MFFERYGAYTLQSVLTCAANSVATGLFFLFIYFAIHYLYIESNICRPFSPVWVLVLTNIVGGFLIIVISFTINVILRQYFPMASKLNAITKSAYLNLFYRIQKCALFYHCFAF